MKSHGELAHLASGAWELEAQPTRGGAVTALRHRGRSLLISPDPTTLDAMGTASFVLVPYANRIVQGRFSAQGRSWILPRNFGEHAHPLHGTGWKRPWSVAAQRADAIEMSLRHSADAHWPWAFTAQQRINLLADGVRFELSVSNDASEPAPMGVGFHPAFAASAATRLRTQLDGVWLTDDESLPISLAPAREVLSELSGAVPVLRSKLVDHCFTGWSGELRIEYAGVTGEISLVELRASPEMNFLQLYMPPGKSLFCAEPMSQMPDAVNRHAGAQPTGLRWLAPGERMQVWMTIAVREAPATTY